MIVRPAGGFGAPGAIRVTVGTPEENELFGEALGGLVPQRVDNGHAAKPLRPLQRRVTNAVSPSASASPP